MTEYEVDRARREEVTQSNELVQNRIFCFSLSEMRLWLYICSLIKHPICYSDENISEKQRTFKLNIRDYAQICGTDFTKAGGSVRAHLKAIFKSLADRSVYMMISDHVERLIRLFDMVEFDHDAEDVTVRLSEDIAVYLFKLHGKFTKYSLWIALSMSSVQSIRLYEYLASNVYRNEDTILPIEKAKQLLFLFGKDCMVCRDIMTSRCLKCRIYKNYYPSFKEFHRKVIKKAVDDITRISDLDVSYEIIKYGNKARSIRFTVKKKDQLKLLDKSITARNTLDNKINQHRKHTCK